MSEQYSNRNVFPNSPSAEQLPDETVVSEIDLAARNQEIESLLDSEHRLPAADVYPILGGAFMEADLDNKMPEGTLLPIAEAVESGRHVSLILGAEGKIAVGIDINPNNGLNDPHTLSIIDTFGHPELLGKGYGKKAYLEMLKALPPGVEITSHAILKPDGQRMWDWLLAHGLAEERADYDPSNQVAGRYITKLNAVMADM